MILRRLRSWALLLAGAITVVLGFALATTFSDNAAGDDWTAPGNAARKVNPIPADAASIAAGKVLYVKNCMACHGPAGKGDGPAAFALDPQPKDLSNPKIAAQSDGALFWKITEGRKPMPSFDTQITKTERWQIINYVRTLQPHVATTSSQPATQPK